MLTCTWAPTVFTGMQLTRAAANGARPMPRGPALTAFVRDYVARVEALGIDHILVPQRWWGSGQEMEGSSLDCLAMTALIAGASERIRIVTAIHPGFFSPTAIAKWGATIDAISGGRWGVNVTSGWNLAEFEMYGIDPLPHGERYARASEFIEVLRGAWRGERFDYEGRYYRAQGLQLEPRPEGPLTIFQGGQSDDAIAMGSAHSDWMFLNGGDIARIADIVAKVRARCAANGRHVRFAMHANPLVRDTDADAWAEIDGRVAALDPERVARRRAALGGASGMWRTDDALSMLDSNEGFAARLIGSAATVLERLQAFADAGIELLHLTLADPRFVQEVLPQLGAIAPTRQTR